MKRLLTLITLLFLYASLAVAAHAKKRSRVHKVHAPFILSATATDTISSYNLIYFAQSLIGTPYREASSDPSHGFDCSGFVSYVFKSFNADVPRSSEDFISVGRKIRLEDARTGDIILFTGTKSHHPHRIGNVGIV